MARLTQEEAERIITESVSCIKTLREALQDTRKQLVPLAEENNALKLQVQILDAADAKVDASLSGLRDLLDDKPMPDPVAVPSTPTDPVPPPPAASAPVPTDPEPTNQATDPMPTVPTDPLPDNGANTTPITNDATSAPADSTAAEAA